MTNMSERKIRIVVVDNDLQSRDLLSRDLGGHGFEVKSVGDATALDQVLARESIDVVVLDLKPPGEDGLSICHRLRTSSSELYIVMLTEKADELDRIVGLELGADDYLLKPLNPRELVARINALLRRRAAPYPPGAPARVERKLTFGACVLDFATRTLTREGRVVALTTGEFALLKVLVEHPRQPLSREKLMELARGRGHEPYDRAIDVQVSRLRKLIEAHPSQPRFIQTVRGFGYVFVPDGAHPGADVS